MPHDPTKDLADLSRMRAGFALSRQKHPAAKRFWITADQLKFTEHLFGRLSDRIIHQESQMGQAALAIAQLKNELATSQENEYDPADLAAIASVLTPSTPAPSSQTSSGSPATTVTATDPTTGTTATATATDPTAAGTAVSTATP